MNGCPSRFVRRQQRSLTILNICEVWYDDVIYKADFPGSLAILMPCALEDCFMREGSGLVVLFQIFVSRFIVACTYLAITHVADFAKYSFIFRTLHFCHC